MAISLRTILDGLASPFSGRFETNATDAGLTPHSVLEIAGTGVGVNQANPLPTQDNYNGPFVGVSATFAPGTPVPAGQSFGWICSVAGNVQVLFQDGSTLTFPVSVGMNSEPWAVTEVLSAGTTATATYFNLKQAAL